MKATELIIGNIVDKLFIEESGNGENYWDWSFSQLDEIEEQEEFHRVHDEVKERLKDTIERRVNRLKGEDIEGDYYIKLSEVIDVIQSVD